MTESVRAVSAQRLRHRPQVLANIPPNADQRSMARAFVLALLAILAGTWPFATVELPQVVTFVSSLPAKLFVSDCVTAVASGYRGGVGMVSICRSIIEGHGGQLWVAPNNPVGAKFQFVPPAETATAVGVS
jgi:hypothetical protein